ncbi:MAG: carboxylating nicotinate-nucleotide diphosphorylase [Methylococcales bacterium]|nr:carboxylating nicotinate-nucleotide diphosphorylase [Methylococcales bacterium]
MTEFFIIEQIKSFLQEDVGSGDLSAALLPANQQAHAQVCAKESCVLAGQAGFDAVFRYLDAEMAIHWRCQDGDAVAAGQVLCQLQGSARALLTGERTALNLLQTLCATATHTRQFVDAVQGTGAVILDTRKTLPGLRRWQKYAVTCGGGVNHRMGLYDAVMIKENHIHAAGSLAGAIAQAKQGIQVPVIVEVETLAELEVALAAEPERILLDDFSLQQLRAAVTLTGRRIALEASGGIDLGNVRAIAETGVDFISVGALTKHIQAVDLSLRFCA